MTAREIVDRIVAATYTAPALTSDVTARLDALVALIEAGTELRWRKTGKSIDQYDSARAACEEAAMGGASDEEDNAG